MDIKIETQPKLEVLFISLDESNLARLDDILSVPEINVSEKALIRKYKVLFKELNGVPSIETLTKEFPSLYFEEIKPISKNQIGDYINLFISNRKNSKISAELLELSSIIRETGIDESVISKLDSITKADTISREFKDVSKDILDIYKNHDNSKGYKTGVRQIDELTRWFKARHIKHYLRLDTVVLKLPGL